MRLNQVTVTMPDLDAGWDFYRRLGLTPIVDARPHYVRFLCPVGEATFSLHEGNATGGGTTVYFECDDLDVTVNRLTEAGIVFAHAPVGKSWLWREAELFDPGGNRIVLYFAGANRIDPPWRLPQDAAVR
ncbi:MULTISPECIES: VOC family protein [Sinorhizobium/Ensifer group]|jgi:catechol 2,3-dioxygenase-like lactoylglutathione lyase family enzyme|uniref:VOC family protein n=1 Tax=Sinorhizobium/Ensifer group TaxID=227292 RepID=UPI00071DB996|nr:MULTISPECIES: glyoxalase/bleomycin resistance/extradiol dioxygenase family protein [Sinorhizobium/Ensifer group]KSV76862.1 bleomycin resistance protein [Sinorhizobium sp. Sb3]KSV94175.1 bleomycin resistance protein [Sinorhizobium sp. GL28]MBD9507248.1 glyoxalase/bleomycin resistance/extradiol dioxygenase family protein [Ensifer sp. ENS10]